MASRCNGNVISALNNQPDNPTETTMTAKQQADRAAYWAQIQTMLKNRAEKQP